MHLELNGLLLAKRCISNIELKFSICTTCHTSIEHNKIPKLALANGLWIGIAPRMLPKFKMVKDIPISRYRRQTILFKLRYTNKGGIIQQHAFKGNVLSFAQDPEHAIKLLGELQLSLKPLSHFVAVHFVGITHPPIDVYKSCKFLYECKYVVTLWLTWLKFNHIGYMCTTINTHGLNVLLDNNILDLILGSIFKSTNI